MKLDKFLEAHHLLVSKYRLPPMAVLMLSMVASKWEKDEVTITDMIMDNPHASQATAHKYIHLLIKKKILDTYTPADGRVKFLQVGTKYDEIQNLLAGV